MKDNTITSRSMSRNLTQDVAVCGLFTALIAVGAFIKIVIPVGADTMNFTLQWLFVLLAGLLLGSKRAFRSVAVYLITGLIGFPIFARAAVLLICCGRPLDFCWDLPWRHGLLGFCVKSSGRQNPSPGFSPHWLDLCSTTEWGSFIFT